MLHGRTLPPVVAGVQIVPLSVAIETKYKKIYIKMSESREHLKYINKKSLILSFILLFCSLLPFESNLF